MKRLTRRGSALVITLLMISVISTVSFVITALTLSEIHKASNLQDSIAAYYAAESGIEHGLMEFRIWHDAEISQDVYNHVHNIGVADFTSAELPTATATPQSFRLVGTDGTANGVDTPGFMVDSSQQGTIWYDLKQYYRAMFIGAIDGTGTPVIDAARSPRVYRNSSVDYNIKGADRIQLRWVPDPATLASPPPSFQTNQNDPNDPNQQGYSDYSYFIELVPGPPTNSCSQVNDQLLRKLIGPIPALPNQSPALIDISFPCKYDTLRIKPWNMAHMQYSLVLMGAGTVLPVDTNRTTIGSTGYSGNAKRTLSIDFSRTVGTGLESSDFLFLSTDQNKGQIQF